MQLRCVLHTLTVRTERSRWPVTRNNLTEPSVHSRVQINRVSSGSWHEFFTSRTVEELGRKREEVDGIGDRIPFVWTTKMPPPIDDLGTWNKPMPPRTCWRLAYGRARNRGRGKDLAEVVAQEAVLSANQETRVFPSKRDFKNWFNKVVESKLADQAREFYKRREVLVADPASVQHPGLNPPGLGSTSEAPGDQVEDEYSERSEETLGEPIAPVSPLGDTARAEKRTRSQSLARSVYLGPRQSGGVTSEPERITAGRVREIQTALRAELGEAGLSILRDKYILERPQKYIATDVGKSPAWVSGQLNDGNHGNLLARARKILDRYGIQFSNGGYRRASIIALIFRPRRTPRAVAEQAPETIPRPEGEFS